MDIVTKMDEWGKPAWITSMIVGFVVFWPIGLGILAYLLWSGRMRCWSKTSAGKWHNERGNNNKSHWFGKDNVAPTSGNHAFDDYRTETLDRLELEQKSFKDFLDRLRQAKDKAEFDQFMSELKTAKPDAPEAKPPAKS